MSKQTKEMVTSSNLNKKNNSSNLLHTQAFTNSTGSNNLGSSLNLVDRKTFIRVHYGGIL
jgi:hypothetical protein